MIARVLIDTNILVYAYNTKEGAKHEKAFEMLNYWIRSKKAAISTQVLAEFAVVMSN